MLVADAYSAGLKLLIVKQLYCAVVVRRAVVSDGVMEHVIAPHIHLGSSPASH